MFKTVTGLAALAMIIALTSCNSASIKQDNRIVASYKGNQISFSKFEQDMLKDKFRDNLAQAAKSSVKEREDFLRNQMIEKIIDDKAAELKLDTLKISRDQIAEGVSKMAKDRLYEEVVVKKIVKDDELKAEFENSKKSVRAQHILIKAGKPEESAKAKTTADSLYNLLTGGADFNALAAKFSDDKGNSEKGGDLGFFNRGQMVKPFEETAYALKVGEISKPVETQFGWHIIKLNEIKQNESIKSFEDSKQEIRMNLFRARRDQASKVTEDYIAYLRNHFNTKVDSANVVSFIAKYEKVSLLPDSLTNDSTVGFNEHDRNLLLVEYKDQKYTANTIIRESAAYPPTQGRPTYKTINDVAKFFDRYIINDLLERIIDELGYKNNQDIISKAKLSLKPLYRQELEKRFALESVVDPTSEEMTTYYEANKEKLYKNKEEFRPFEEVKESIRVKLRREAEAKARTDWYNSLASQYEFKADKLLLEEAFYFVEDNKK